MKYPSDQEIITWYWARNEKAIVFSKQKYEGVCRSVSASVLCCREDVEECLNDLYFAAWNTIPPQRPVSLRAYLCKLIRRISVNKLVHHQAQKRDQRKTVSFEEAEAELNAVFSEDAFLTDHNCLSEWINLYLSALPQKRRQILVLRYWMCASVREISEKTGTKEGTVKSILSRELVYLRRYLIEKGGYRDE